MKKILIVEDDMSIHQFIEELLKQNHYLTYHAYSGSEAMLLLKNAKYDCILLDLMLPAIHGEEIIKEVKDIPIIVLSAKSGSEDKVNCLLSGASDYMTKPFDANELLARIEVQLRKRSLHDKADTLKYKDLELLNDHRTLLVNHKKISLTKTEYAICKQLMANPKQVITKNKLLDCISMDTEDCDENSLKVHISHIRKKMKRVSEEAYIESVWGIGFKMKD